MVLGKHLSQCAVGGHCFSAELAHLTEHGDGAGIRSGGRGIGQRGNGRVHGIGVGVIGIIDGGYSIAAGTHVHAVFRGILMPGKRVSYYLRVHARFDSSRGRSQSVRDLVLAKDLQLYRKRVRSRRMQHKRGAGDVIELDIAGVVLGVGSRRFIGRVVDDLGRGARRHAGDEGIIGIEHGDAAFSGRGQGFNELAFGLGNILA